MTKIWRGFHSAELLDLVKGALDHKYLLILVSPTHKDFSFITSLPNGPIELIGDWQATEDLQKTIQKESSVPRQNSYPETPVLGVFTSGTSSGYSRLILYSRENLVSSLESIRSLFDCNRLKTIFCFPQPTHIFGLALGYVHAALYDVRLIVHEGKYSRETQKFWFDSVDADTLTLGAPAHFSDLVNAPAGEFRASYASICGGAPVPKQLWLAQKYLLRIAEPSIGYGASEASPGVTHLAPGVEPCEDGEIGSALPGVEVRIVPEQGLEFSGPNLCIAYVENRKLTFPRSLVLGDWIEPCEGPRRSVSSPTAAGPDFVFKGRYSAVLNRGGQKFSLERIETFVKAKTGLDCIAVGIPEARLGEELGLLFRGQLPARSTLLQNLKAEFGFSTEHIVLNCVSDLPVNQNFKPDRHRAKLLIFRPLLPSPVSEFSRWLPHREDAIWVDSVLEADSNSGVCEVNLDNKKNYFNERGIRNSSYIEWMAQSYGFVKAYQEIMTAGTSDKPKRVFLVAVKDFELVENSTSEKFKVAVKQTHQLGPMALVSAQVSDNEGRIIARGELKLFAEI